MFDKKGMYRMQNDNNTSAVFGLNWLQDMPRGEVTGAYDPDKEMWVGNGRVLAATDPAFDGFSTDPGTDGSVINTGTTTSLHTAHSTATNFGQPDSDLIPDSSPDNDADQDFDS